MTTLPAHDDGGVLTLPRPEDTTLQSAPAPSVPLERWRATHRFGFRFVCAYFVLYLLPFPLDQGLPFLSSAAAQAFQSAWQFTVTWVASSVWQIPERVTLTFTGSGDKLYDYVQNFTVLVLALIAALVWSLLDRRQEHARLREWLRLYVRLGLGAVAIGYGAYKVVQSQFPMPSLDKLAQPFGEQSPMGLLWSFIGFSPAYNLFTGLGELVGGALLFFRRTALLGALLLITVLANIVILNFAYDVPVKLYSSNLLLMAIWLAAFDARRLVDLLVLNRTAAPQPEPALLNTRLKLRLLTGYVLLLLAFVLYQTLSQSYSGYRTYGEAAPRPPLYGLYDTELFVRDGQVHPPLLTDTLRWRRATFSRRGVLSVRLMNDSVRYFRVRVDPVARTALLTLPSDSTQRMILSYVVPAENRLILTGQFRGATVRALFHRRDESSFLLMNRGFNWIQERPFNR
jgi:hypothetical protein